jgi:predicted lipoprotein with Yx(FWY)xxD motif
MAIPQPEEATQMKRLLTPTTVIAAALAIGACGGGGGGGGSAASSGRGGTVGLRDLPGVGRVLVDPAGKPIYTSDQEANGKLVCTDACTAFWKPVPAAGRRPSGAPGAGRLGAITRPDGMKQITADGKPLYTFSEDSPGKATGDGFSDDFAGRHFTWHVVRSGSQSSGGGRGGSAPPDTGGSGDDYGY